MCSKYESSAISFKFLHHVVVVCRVFHIVKIGPRNLITSCNCKGYKFAKICSHSVAVADMEEHLEKLVTGGKSGFRKSLTYPLAENSGQEEKGPQKKSKKLHFRTTLQLSDAKKWRVFQGLAQ